MRAFAEAYAAAKLTVGCEVGDDSTMVGATAETLSLWSVVLSGASLLAVVLIGLRSLGLANDAVKATQDSAKAARDSADATNESLAVTRHVAAITETAARYSRQDLQRRRVEAVLDRVEAIEVLARKAITMDALTQTEVARDDTARIPLQASLVSLRTYLDALPVHLPKTKEWANQGTRDDAGIHRILGSYLDTIYELREALVQLYGPDQE